MKTPITYADWVSAIEILELKSDDEGVLEAFSKGTIEWQDGIASRFSKRLLDAVNSRISKSLSKFRLQMSRITNMESDLVKAILELRKEMIFLSKVVDIKAIPEECRKSYIELIIKKADEIQKSLEESSENDKTGQILSIIRKNRVNSFVVE